MIKTFIILIAIGNNWTSEAPVTMQQIEITSSIERCNAVKDLIASEFRFSGNQVKAICIEKN